MDCGPQMQNRKPSRCRQQQQACALGCRFNLHPFCDSIGMQSKTHLRPWPHRRRCQLQSKCRRQRKVPRCSALQTLAQKVSTMIAAATCLVSLPASLALSPVSWFPDCFLVSPTTASFAWVALSPTKPACRRRRGMRRDVHRSKGTASEVSKQFINEWNIAAVGGLGASELQAVSARQAETIAHSFCGLQHRMVLWPGTAVDQEGLAAVNLVEESTSNGHLLPRRPSAGRCRQRPVPADH